MTHPASLVSSLKRPLTHRRVFSKPATLWRKKKRPFFSGPGRTQQLRQLVRPFHPPLPPPPRGGRRRQPRTTEWAEMGRECGRPFFVLPDCVRGTKEEERKGGWRKERRCSRRRRRRLPRPPPLTPAYGVHDARFAYVPYFFGFFRGRRRRRRWNVAGRGKGRWGGGNATLPLLLHLGSLLVDVDV